MGNQPSVPKPGTKFQVIGAGLSRTGTASFSEAIRILLNGPVYHGGTQATLGPEVEIRSWIKLLSRFPPKSPADKELIQDMLKQRFDGYAAATDAPTCGLVEELVEVFPDAMVICTIRHPDAWVKSMDGVSNASTMWFLRFVLFPISGMRYFVDYINVLRNQWLHLYGETEPVTTKTHHNHVEYLKRVVPEDRLLFFNVKDGWEPLCKALGKEVPDIPFPRINDGKAIDQLAKTMVIKGLLRWMAIFATLGVALINKRLDSNTSRPDFMTTFLKKNGNFDTMSRKEILATFNFVIVGGSETSATVLTGLFSYIARDERIHRRLSDEIREKFNTEDDIDIDAIQDLPYLEAVLQEGLRVCNPVPCGLPRVVPPGGDSYCGHFLPAGTRINTLPAQTTSCLNAGSPFLSVHPNLRMINYTRVGLLVLDFTPVLENH